MKIWIVTCYVHWTEGNEDYYECFSSEEKAKEFVIQQEFDEDDYDIYDYDLDSALFNEGDINGN